MKLCFGRRNDVGSRFRGNRQTHTQTDRTTTVILRRMRRGLMIEAAVSLCWQYQIMCPLATYGVFV
jgi:hypothetical protein